MLLLLLISIQSIPRLAAQDTSSSSGYRCLSDEMLRNRLDQEPDFAQRHRDHERQMHYLTYGPGAEKTQSGDVPGQTYYVPVVVHIIYDNEQGTENISDAQVQDQIEILNRDYSTTYSDPDGGGAINPNIQFFLARLDPQGNPTNGITRTQSIYTYHGANFGDCGDTITRSTEQELKSLIQWPPEHYLNVWVVHSICSDILGYAGFPCSTAPESDGIVIGHRQFGSLDGYLNENYNLGRTMTHEVGHWLDLHHPWFGFPVCSGGSPADCETAGDYVCDTPPTAEANYGCSARNTCIEVPFDRPDMIENYMDYTPDRCMSAFSPDQVARMRAAFRRDCSGDTTFRVVSRFNIWRTENLIRTGFEGAVGLETSLSEVLGLRAFPNPFQQEVTVEFTVRTAGTYTWLLTDALGRVVYAREVQLQPGVQQVRFRNLAEQLYGFRLQTPRGVVSLKLVRAGQ